MTPDRTSRFTCLVTSSYDPGTFFPGLQEPVVPTFQQDIKYDLHTGSLRSPSRKNQKQTQKNHSCWNVGTTQPGKPWEALDPGHHHLQRSVLSRGSPGGRSNIPTKGNFFYSIVYCDFFNQRTSQTHSDLLLQVPSTSWIVAHR
jgi:hypothetical protein